MNEKKQSFWQRIRPYIRGVASAFNMFPKIPAKYRSTVSMGANVPSYTCPLCGFRADEVHKKCLIDLEKVVLTDVILSIQEEVGRKLALDLKHAYDSKRSS